MGPEPSTRVKPTGRVGGKRISAQAPLTGQAHFWIEMDRPSAGPAEIVPLAYGGPSRALRARSRSASSPTASAIARSSSAAASAR